MNGTWTQLASKPFISYAAAQAVLADGRVIIEGGEYSNYEYDFLLTNQGAIYDPVTNTWTSVPEYPAARNRAAIASAAFAVSPVAVTVLISTSSL